MSQTKNILNTLKNCLKANGKTYTDVAEVLDLTEASVKRLFSEQSFSLDRLDKVCQMLDMDITELIQKMNESQYRVEQLSHKQEMEITEDIILLLVMVCIFNHWKISDITTHYKVSAEECVSKLLILDSLRIINLLPNNKVKLLIAPNFKWLENGPIQRFFQENIGKEYFDSDFKNDDECLFVLNGMLSLKSNGEFQRKLQRLISDFNDLNNDDVALDIGERNGVTLVMAIRNWEYGLFSHLQNN